MRVVIQHHPDRSHLIPSLLAEVPDAEIVTDPGHGDGVSPWRCYRACLERALELGGTVAIVQDDAILCPSFLEVAARACAVKPDDPVAFFVTGRDRLADAARNARANGYRFVQIDRGDPNVYIPVVATAWPQDKIEHFLKWARGYAPESRDLTPGFRADDGITGKWLRRNRMKAWVTIPNLVEHPDTEPSLIKRRSDVIAERKKRPRERRVSAVPWEGDPLPIVWDPCALHKQAVA